MPSRLLMLTTDIAGMDFSADKMKIVPSTGAFSTDERPLV